MRLLAGAATAALLFVVLVPRLLWGDIGAARNLRRSTYPVADGGTVSRYSWFVPGFVDSSGSARVIVTG